MNHKQKLCYIESEPIAWPKGWAFGPYAPCPPGWPMKLDLEGVKLLATGSILFQVHDKWNEPTDILDGHAIRIQAVSGREIVRMRLDELAPWSEQLILIVRNGKVERTVLFDWQRAETPEVAVLIQTLGVQPMLSVPLRVKRE